MPNYRKQLVEDRLEDHYVLSDSVVILFLLTNRCLLLSRSAESTSTVIRSIFAIICYAAQVCMLWPWTTVFRLSKLSLFKCYENACSNTS